jgi:glycosyltransferase involved in cell wall biosynthesis
MISSQKVVVVLPAYNAERTLEKVVREIPRDIVDDVILVDDCSPDNTAACARRLGITTYVHERNRGYGGNQKTCYTKALEAGADIVVMLHPDYQYDGRIISALAGLVASGVFDCALGSRILGGMARKGGMPGYKYFFNRVLTFAQNAMLGQKLSEYHTGLRAFSRRFLQAIPFQGNSEDFVFDNQVLVQAVYFGFSIGEVTAPCRYTQESSSIGFRRSCVYGLGCLAASWAYVLQRWGIAQSWLFKNSQK